MGKFVLVIVLGVIAVVLVAAVSGKKPIEMLKGISAKLIRKDEDGNISVPPIPMGSGNIAGISTGTTLIIPVLHITQVDEKGNTFFRHDIASEDFYDDEDNMIGIPVSRPGADSEGIKLHGEKDKRGQYNSNDKNTYNALTVNTNAITLGIDDEGFYGEVTNNKSTVYIVDENNKKVKLSYGEQFEIKDGTFVLVNYQWLYFSLPVVPEIPGMATSNTGIQTDDNIPTFIKNGKNIGGRAIGARKMSNKAEKKTIVVKKNEVAAQEPTRGFPLDEDDF